MTTDSQPAPKVDPDDPATVAARILDQVQSLADDLRAETVDDELQQRALIPLASRDSALAAPSAPVSLSEAGLPLALACDLALKLVYLGGTLSAFEISQQIHLPFSVLAEALDALKADRCLEVTSSEMVGRLSFRYHLTDAGRIRAREAFRLCRYVGPAPVTLAEYAEQCRGQSPRLLTFTLEQLTTALADLVLEPAFVRRLGPAICHGQSIFLHGPSGTGKTAIAGALGHLLHDCGGPIYVPYAVTVENQLISVFDPQVHLDPLPKISEAPAAGTTQLLPEMDSRWRQVRRPVICAGGELSLEMLELRDHPHSGYSTAPLQMKANGGVFLIDDFGRQLVPAPQLLNRWILPLEDRHDFLTLSTGKKFSIPFEQLTIFSTNLPPEGLVDTAFLRRIRHKVKVDFPREQEFREIFRRSCEQRGMKYDDWLLSRLLAARYNPQNPPKSSDPRDLLEGIVAICRFQGVIPHLSEELLLEAYDSCLATTA